MMIIQDKDSFEAETTMIGEQNSIIKEDEINDLSIGKLHAKANDDLGKSTSKRKQIKPNRVTSEDETIPTDLTNGQSPSPSEENPSDPNKAQEAYCNLCDRSFCNKYFLKTHFAKKHGALNLISPPSDSPPPLPPADQPLPLIADQKSNENYCEICQKRFCNKYYLRKHKGECHGVYTDYIKSLQKSSNESPVKSNTSSRPMPSAAPFYLPSDIKSSHSNENNHQQPNSSSSSSSPPPPASTQTTALPLPSLQRPVRRCHICQQEFRNKASLRMHLSTVHATEVNQKKSTPVTPIFPISPSANLGFLQPYVDTSSPLAHKLVAGQAPQASYGILHDSYFCAKMADRVVCEICNKQVCNKYFLKTHKAKVHGITNGGHSADEKPPTMVPIPSETEALIKSSTDLEHSETYCSICKKDFPTKYFYIFHMQTMHQEASEATFQNLLEFMRVANAMNASNPTTTTTTTAASTESEDESDGNTEKLKRKRSSSQSSTETSKRMSLCNETNGGLQPFLIESEDPSFAQTFVPCMVYLPVVRRVTRQVKINLRLKPVLADASA